MPGGSAGDSFRSIPDGQINRLCEAADKIAESIGRKFSSDDGVDRLGFCLTLMDGEGSTRLEHLAGKPLREKVEAFKLNASIKCRVMFEHRGDRAISSWQYRDMEAKPPVYGGGVLFDRIGCYGSISGYTQPIDELVIIALGAMYGYVSEEHIVALLAISGNSQDLFGEIREEIMSICLAP